MTYETPTAATLKIRFPAFATVADETVEYWLTDARLIVTDSWFENDRAPAEMSLAAHNMAMNGLGSSGGAVSDIAQMGVTRFRSGAMDVSFSEAAVEAQNSGGYASTRYGKLFLPYLRRNRGGATTVVTSTVPAWS